MKKQVINWVKNNKYTIIFLACLLLTSTVSIVNILYSAVPQLDGAQFYEDVGEYDFKVVANKSDEVPLVEELSDKVHISWNTLTGYFYLSSFDGGVGSPPSSNYEDLALIPEGAKKICLDISLQGEYITDSQNRYEVILYLGTYNDDGRIDLKSLDADFQNDRERPRNFSISIDVNDDAKYFKILMRVSASKSKSENGYIDISRLDVTFR